MKSEAFAILCCLCALFWAGAVRAAGPIQIEIVVSQISNQPGGIDERAKKLHRKLRREFRYQSLKVVQSKTFEIDVDEVASLELPNGRVVRVTPLLVDERGALLAVEVEGTLQTDLRVKSNHLVVIGAQRYGDGKLVISLQPRF
ncbi:MAG: hypothetical protein O7G30_04530 [Proteobacteria bacterium]|nr:hypothetical protein [Pseudomonadota bacterium]